MNNEEQSKFFTLSKIVFYLLAIMLFALAVRYVGKFGDISKLIVQIDPLWFTLAIASQILTYATNSMTLSIILKKTEQVKFITLFKISVVIMFVNQALPTGGLSGNWFVFNQLIRRKVTATDAYIALMTQIICYYAAVVLALTFFYSYYLNYSGHTNAVINYAFLIGFCYFTLLGVSVIIVSNKQTLQFLTKKLRGFPIIRTYVEKFRFPSTANDQPDFLKNLWIHKKSTMKIISFQLFIIFFDILTVWAISKGFQVTLSIQKISLTVILSQVIGALPISPGSLIAYESAMTYFLTILGMPLHASLIVTLLFRFLTFWLPIPIGLLLYRSLTKKHE